MLRSLEEQRDRRDRCAISWFLWLSLALRNQSVPFASTLRTFIGRVPPDSPVLTAVQKKQVEVSSTTSRMRRSHRVRQVLAVLFGLIAVDRVHDGIVPQQERRASRRGPRRPVGDLRLRNA